LYRSDDPLRRPCDRAAADLPPVVILGGEANALSVARDLGRRGVRVYALVGRGAPVAYSRYCERLALPDDATTEEDWAAFLLGPESEHLRGAVLLSCSDAGLQVLIRHRGRLLERYRLDDCHPPAQAVMLDKLSTYQWAREAGVLTPGFWKVDCRAQVLALRDELIFPLMVKPRLSHRFEARFGRKHVIVSGLDELLGVFDSATDAGMDVLLMEYIPGGDERLCSYYTYLDDDSRPLFDFTKRVIRRYPAEMGAACYHVTDWIPELVPLANRLFSHVRLRGLANVEFKRDPRDAQYKLIECNARFTASNCLVSASGFDLANFVYNRIVGLPQQRLEQYRRGLRLWDPLRDWRAFRELRSAGRITFFEWLAGVSHGQTFAYFRWSDPMPAVARAIRPVRRGLRRLTSRGQPVRPRAGAQPA
jgi:predicted ATP-grasp superfamily ATP-dependent carboligase